MKQQIILFIEPAKEEWRCPESIGNLYLNRFVIDEDAAHEVLGVYYLQQSSAEVCNPFDDLYANNAMERDKKERFDNKIFERGIKLASKNRSSTVQNHIFTTGFFHEKTSKRMEHISNLIQHYKISSIVLTQLILNRIRVNPMENVKLAYKDDQGILGTTMKLYINYIVFGDPFEQRIHTSVLNDIDALFEKANISAIRDSIKNDENFQYSFLFQKFTLDELEVIKRKEPGNLKRFLRYCGKSDQASIDEMEMESSESESRYANLYSLSVTNILEGSSHCNSQLYSKRSKKNRRPKKQLIKKNGKR